MKIGFTSKLSKLYGYFPGMSTEIKDTIVRILPALSLIFGILITIASIADLLGSFFITSFTLNGGGSQVIQQLFLRSVVGFAQGLLMIFAFQALRHRSSNGWKLFFWSQILWITSTLIVLSPSFILGLIILYPLFQVRSYYK